MMDKTIEQMIEEIGQIFIDQENDGSWSAYNSDEFPCVSVTYISTVTNAVRALYDKLEIETSTSS